MTNEVMRDPELPRLARRINDREEVLEKLKTQIETDVFSVLTEAKLQGQDLIAARDRLPKAGFMDDWLKANCSRSALKANVYIGIASRWEKLTQYSSTEAHRCVQQLLLPEDTDPTPTEPKRWPAYYEAGLRMERIVKYIECNPWDAWSDVQRDQLRDKALPLARKLWPERFNDVL